MGWRTDEAAPPRDDCNGAASAAEEPRHPFPSRGRCVTLLASHPPETQPCPNWTAANSWYAAVVACGPAVEKSQAADREGIKAENDKEGTIDWQLTYTRIDPKSKCTRFGGGLGGRSTLVEGFASCASVRAGDKLDFYVYTDPPSPFVIDFRQVGPGAGRAMRLVAEVLESEVPPFH